MREKEPILSTDVLHLLVLCTEHPSILLLFFSPLFCWAPVYLLLSKGPWHLILQEPNQQDYLAQGALHLRRHMESSTLYPSECCSEERRTPPHSLVHKELTLFCPPDIHQLGRSTDSVQEIKDFEPQRGAHYSAFFTPNAFLAFAIQWKMFVLEASSQTKAKRRFPISSSPTVHVLRKFSCVMHLSLPGIISPHGIPCTYHIMLYKLYIYIMYIMIYHVHIYHTIQTNAKMNQMVKIKVGPFIHRLTN